MTERRADRPMVTEGEEAVHPPFGGYVLETETMPDGRLIRYYSWPEDAATAPTADAAGSGAGETPS